MNALTALILIAGTTVSAAAQPSAPKELTLAEVIAKMKQGVTTENPEWQVLHKDEDRSIPALLDLMEHPDRCQRGLISLAIGGFQDYHLQNHISERNRKLIGKRASGFLSSDDYDLRDEGLKLLDSYPDQAAVEPLKKFIKGGAPDFQRAFAERTLVRQLETPAALQAQKDFFSSLRSDSNYSVSSAARRILAQEYKDPDEARAQAKAANTEYGSVDAAAKAMATGNDWMVPKAAQELVRDGVSALPALIEIANAHKDQRVRSAATAAIRQVVGDPANRTKEAASALRDCLRAASAEFFGCADDLAMIDLPEAREALIECAVTATPAQMGCLHALRPPLDKQALARLKTVLQEKESKVRPMAAYLLAASGDASGLGVLRDELAAISSKEGLGDTPEGRAASFNAAHVVDSFGYIGDESDLAALRKFKVPSKHYQRNTEHRVENAVRGIDLRTKHGDVKGQIRYLKQQFESTGDGWAAHWLILLMGDRGAAEYFLPFARRPYTPKGDPIQQAALSWLTGNGWVDMADVMKNPTRFALRDRPARPR